MKRIFLVEDEKTIARNLALLLQAEGFAVTHAGSQKEALSMLDSTLFDLALVDISLPDGNGFAVCTEIKQTQDIPVIFLTASGDEASVVTGLNIGAEDYITKPFRIQIAMEKIQAVLRRCGGRHEEPCYSCGNLDIDFEKRIVRKNGELLELTPTEFDLLQFFCKNRRKILTKDILLENIWDNRRRFVSEHTLSLNISRLRNKIADDQFDYIKTIYGMGYRWIGAGEAGV